MNVAEITAGLPKELWEDLIESGPRGHLTRYSDSSLYDEICIFCGRVDGMPLLGFPNTLDAHDCSTGLAVRAYILENKHD
jgi:hypothetical protein